MYTFIRLLDARMLIHRSSEAMREIAVLWLVFSVLDKLVVDELTTPWLVTNSTAAAGIWVLSLYIEVYGRWRDQ